MEMKKIHEDERGEIYSIPLSENEDIAILKTNKGYARGGHSHDTDEYFIVVKGIVKYWIDDHHELYHQGMSDFTPRGSKHFFVSLTDSIVIHWGANRSSTVEDREYRACVEKVNKEYQP